MQRIEIQTWNICNIYDIEAKRVINNRCTPYDCFWKCNAFRCVDFFIAAISKDKQYKTTQMQKWKKSCCICVLTMKFFLSFSGSCTLHQEIYAVGLLWGVHVTVIYTHPYCIYLFRSNRPSLVLWKYTLVITTHATERR